LLFYGVRLKENLYRFAKKNYGSIKGCKIKWRGNIGLDKTFKEEYKRQEYTQGLDSRNTDGKYISRKYITRRKRKNKR